MFCITNSQLRGCVAENELVIVKITATFCKPCKEIQPAFEKLSQEFTGTLMVQMNVNTITDDELVDNVISLPTFCAFVGQVKIFDQFNYNKIHTLAQNEENLRIWISDIAV